MEQKKLNLKRLIEISLFAFTVVFAFLMLVFKVYDVKITFFGSVIASEGNGFQLIKGYPEALEKIGDWLGIYSIIVMVVIAIEIVLYVIFFLKKNSKITLIEKILVIINVVLSVVYMINGFCAKDTIADGNFYGTVEIKTFAYIPLIIVAIFAVAYFVMAFFVKKDFSITIKSKKNGAISNAEELLKYKQLLDNGIITQEEFDVKKNELLKL